MTVRKVVAGSILAAGLGVAGISAPERLSPLQRRAVRASRSRPMAATPWASAARSPIRARWATTTTRWQSTQASRRSGHPPPPTASTTTSSPSDGKRQRHRPRHPRQQRRHRLRCDRAAVRRAQQQRRERRRSRHHQSDASLPGQRCRRDEPLGVRQHDLRPGRPHQGHPGTGRSLLVR